MAHLLSMESIVNDQQR